jgi:protease PrsW
MSVLSLLPGFVPVLLFLGGLTMMDSFKLVSRRLVLRSIIVGCAAAGLAFLLNGWVRSTFHLDRAAMTGVAGPVTEEILKAALVLYLVARARVGFMVDAGIHGFAVGTGFALVENAYYARALGETSLWLWVFRGLGTAVMHGSTTAIVGVLTKYFTDRAGTRAAHLFLPGVALSILLHSGFNRLGPWPLLATLAALIFAPLVLVLVFEVSERATRDWLGRGFDHDVEILELIGSGEIRTTPTGQYLDALRNRLSGPVVADILCMLQIHLELAARAKGILLAREAGLEIDAGRDAEANLEELRYLERAIGPTGRLAVMPLLRTSSRDLWQIYMLRKTGRGLHARR